MHYSAKPQRINDKVKNRNNQMPPPHYNAGMHFLPAPNISNSGQLQINRKYVNNMGNINEVSVLQYHRTANMQIKNNSLEMNHYQNLRHQQHQTFVYKTPQYHNLLNPNLQQKMPVVNHSMQRKIYGEQTVQAGDLQQLAYKNVEYNSKKSKELQNQQEANKSYTNNKIMPIKFRAIHRKATNSQEDHARLSNAEAAGSVNLITHKQVPEIVYVAEENHAEGLKEDANQTEIQKDMEQVLNINNELTEELDHGEQPSDSSTKAREKTPMCLINDLARFNKISFQYRLTSENGPAHCKRFTVTLKLGDEEYTAEGFKIKKAQHLAAKEAIEKTKYKHPTPKTNRRTDENAAKSNITPTVELNALAMKLGQQTYYIFDPRQMETNTNYRLNSQSFDINKATTQQPPPIGVVESLINNNKPVQSLNQKRHILTKYQNRYTRFQHTLQNSSVPAVSTYFPPTSPCKITLIVGTKQFKGIGRTLQQAKHDAASNALQVLKEQMRNEQLENNNDSVNDNDNKSPISLVFEIGIKRNLPVDFKVLREEGPAHMRTFITACIVGDIVTEGEGTGKKISKKKAAQKMLEELKKLPPLTPVASPVKRVKLKISSKKGPATQPKNTNLVEPNIEDNIERPWHKNKKPTTESDAANPINKLLEWHQNKKEKEPMFKLISEFGKENSRRRQFIMEVSSNEIVARGVGNSKKLAKRDAAQNFLLAIAESEQPTATTADNDITEKATTTSDIKKSVIETTSQNPPRQETLNNKESTLKEQEDIEKIATITTCSSSSSNAVTLKETTTTTTSTKSQNLHMKDQLMYLAKLLGFEVEFSDYPKGNHNEFLTIVMLSTNPPQICHGVGANAKESQEDAAKNALKILSEMGLNNAVNA